MTVGLPFCVVRNVIEVRKSKSLFSMTVTELLETVRRLELHTNRLVHDTMVGAYLSHFKGHGMDFVSFPLTPALSLGERKNCFQLLGKYMAAFCSVALNKQHRSNGCSLSPRERVRVRGNAANFIAIGNRQSKIPMTVTELLETVRRQELPTNRLVNDTMVGAYLSHFKGRGMDVISFPLTPALSLGKRENCFQLLGKYTANFCSMAKK